MSLEGKAILITGGACRVGRTLVLAAAHAGADIFLHNHQSEREAAAGLNAANPLRLRKDVLL
jgi:NAD(P)-dependent dehydrogenase (short-subunit alcohol dehydrogenase family)